MQNELFQIVPLSYDTLIDATTLRDTYFDKLSSNEQELLKASLDPQNFQEILENEAISSLKYWVLLDTTVQKIIGMVGLYSHTGTLNIAWLGWFAVDKTYRKQKLGEKLLLFAIKKAKSQNAKELHLYSWDSKMYQPALKLYEKYDFFCYTPKEKIHKRDIFMKKVL